MKNLFKSIRNKANSMAISAKTALESKSGEGYFVTGLRPLIGIVFAGATLAGLYALFNTTIIPTLTTKIGNMFNYSGT